MTSQFYSSTLLTALIADVDVNDENENDGLSRTELDSHANMPVVGRNSCIIADTGHIAEVNPFTPDYNSMQVPIVDAAIQYECPYSGTSYILVIRNALHVWSMKNNLLPPFLLREAGLQVCDTPKIQVDNPSVDNHAICFPDGSFYEYRCHYGEYSATLIQANQLKSTW
jgi:hypothetical protein